MYEKIFVAPMVRVSTLPFRLLCLDYGADIVYTEETIDFKMLRSIKIENNTLGTTDFVDKLDGTVFFRTCPREKDKLIFQIGTCDSQRALTVSKMVENYVSGIDINMGCPKEFSLKGGMGAALLSQPDKIKDILTTLVQNLNVKVSCKIRVLSTIEETINLCKLIESCGVSHLAIHGRTKEDRPNHANHNDMIREICKQLTIPVIANGGSIDMERNRDIEEFRRVTGASSVMVARAAMWNCSILLKDGVLPLHTVITSYLRYCAQYDNPFTYTKYTIQNILRHEQESDVGRAFLETHTLQEICSVWGLGGFFKECMSCNIEEEARLKTSCRSFVPLSRDNLNLTETVDSDGIKIIALPLQFIRGNYCSARLPKVVLNNHAYDKKLNKPLFCSVEQDKFFCSTVTVNGIKYKSLIREKNKRYAEQGAALVFLHATKIVENTYGLVAQKGTRKHLNFNIHESLKRQLEESHLKSCKLIKIEDR